MNDAPQLQLFVTIDGERRDDMPRLWDGRRVVWSRWRARGRGMVSWHGASSACAECGAPEDWRRPYATGTVYPRPGELEPRPVSKWTRSGRRYRTVEARPARAYRDLFVFRCASCRHDTVIDISTGDVWELEPEDYGPDGSRAGV